jgi:hypothetical protein
MQVALLPWMSVTVHVITVVPAGKYPLASLVKVNELVREAIPQLSVTITAGIVMYPGLLAIMSSGQIICGAWLSVTMMFCWQEEVFPLASVAIHVTIVVPGKYVSCELLERMVA